MKAFAEIKSLGYLIQTVWQATHDDWYVYFRSPYEWERWQAHGTSLSEAATKAATMARRRGPALEASLHYRKHAAASFRTHVKPKRKRIRL